MIYLTIKTIHIVAVIAWMAALFYLPRLFVYHAKHNEEELISSVFKVMESRLYSVIATPAMVAVWLTGIYLVYVQGNQFWLNLKIFFVFLIFKISINSPSFISMLKLLITLFLPKDFSRFLIIILDIYLI